MLECAQRTIELFLQAARQRAFFDRAGVHWPPSVFVRDEQASSLTKEDWGVAVALASISRLDSRRSGYSEPAKEMLGDVHRSFFARTGDLCVSRMQSGELCSLARHAAFVAKCSGKGEIAAVLDTEFRARARKFASTRVDLADGVAGQIVTQLQMGERYEGEHRVVISGLVQTLLKRVGLSHNGVVWDLPQREYSSLYRGEPGITSALMLACGCIETNCSEIVKSAVRHTQSRRVAAAQLKPDVSLGRGIGGIIFARSLVAATTSDRELREICLNEVADACRVIHDLTESRLGTLDLSINNGLCGLVLAFVQAERLLGVTFDLTEILKRALCKRVAALDIRAFASDLSFATGASGVACSCLALSGQVEPDCFPIVFPGVTQWRRASGHEQTCTLDYDKMLLSHYSHLPDAMYAVKKLRPLRAEHMREVLTSPKTSAQHIAACAGCRFEVSRYCYSVLDTSTTPNALKSASASANGKIASNISLIDLDNRWVVRVISEGAAFDYQVSHLTWLVLRAFKTPSSTFGQLERLCKSHGYEDVLGIVMNSRKRGLLKMEGDAVCRLRKRCAATAQDEPLGGNIKHDALSAREASLVGAHHAVQQGNWTCIPLQPEELRFSVRIAKIVAVAYRIDRLKRARVTRICEPVLFVAVAAVGLIEHCIDEIAHRCNMGVK